MSNASDDFPEPEGPVIIVSCRVRDLDGDLFLRLCVLAPRMEMAVEGIGVEKTRCGSAVFRGGRGRSGARSHPDRVPLVEIVVAEALAKASHDLRVERRVGSGDVDLDLVGVARAGNHGRDGLVGQDETERRLP